MEIRNPKRGEGVPKETVERNCIGHLTMTLQSSFSDVNVSGVMDVAVSKGYFEAPMTKQLAILDMVIAEVLGERSDRVIDALIASSDEKVNAVAIAMIVALYEQDLEAMLMGLKRTATLSKTWPREHSCVALHNLFIRYGVEPVLQKVCPWLMDPDEGVRRVVSECIRPRLMMVAHIDELKRNPILLKKVFEPLLDDPSDYVRKSVGNCMNDVSKDNPAMLLEWLEEWSKKPLSKERRQIFSRALRTLIEKGEPRAYRILDVPIQDSVELKVVHGFPQRVSLNQVINLDIEVKNIGDEDTKIFFDLIIKAPGKGSQIREFVYKLPVVEINAKETKVIKKTIHFVDKTTQAKEAGLYEVTYRKNSNGFHFESFRFER